MAFCGGKSARAAAAERTPRGIRLKELGERRLGLLMRLTAILGARHLIAVIRILRQQLLQRADVLQRVEARFSGWARGAAPARGSPLAIFLVWPLAWQLPFYAQRAAV